MIPRHFRHDYVLLQLICSLSVVLTIGLIIFFSYTKSINLRKLSEAVLPTSKQTQPASLFNKNSFSDVTTQARAYIVYDINKQEIIASKNSDEVLPLASLTKVMTAVTARMHSDPTKQVIVTANPIDGNYDLGLQKNQVWKLNELLKYTLLLSSNDGAFMIANALGGESFFIETMNTDAQSLGLSTLSFTNPAGLDSSTTLGGKGSALDTAKLLAYATREYPELFDITTKKRGTVTANGVKLTGIPNTNQSIDMLTEAQASKTGFTDSAGGNLGVVVDVTLGRPIVILVLGSTKEERFSDVGLLYKKLKESIVSESHEK